MRRTISAIELLLAFIDETGSGAGDLHPTHVAFASRGGAPGYVRIYGPHSDPRAPNTCLVVVEMYNGAVVFSNAAIAKELGAQVRPSGLGIASDPLGSSVNVNLGAFKWGLAPMEIARRFSEAGELVREILRVVAAVGLQW